MAYRCRASEASRRSRRWDPPRVRAWEQQGAAVPRRCGSRGVSVAAGVGCETEGVAVPELLPHGQPHAHADRDSAAEPRRGDAAAPWGLRARLQPPACPQRARVPGAVRVDAGEGGRAAVDGRGLHRGEPGRGRTVPIAGGVALEQPRGAVGRRTAPAWLDLERLFEKFEVWGGDPRARYVEAVAQQRRARSPMSRPRSRRGGRREWRRGRRRRRRAARPRCRSPR